MTTNATPQPAARPHDFSFLRSQGEGLGRLQAPMERSFGADFSDVRLHRDGSADALGAQAYAQGSQIHLSRNAADLGSEAGRTLLGHELAHVVQQRESRVATPQGKSSSVVQDPGLEAQADAAGAAAARGDYVSREAERQHLTGRGRGGAASSQSSTRIAAPPSHSPIQLFDSHEHKRAGDHAAGGRSFAIGRQDGDTSRGPYAGPMPSQYRFVLTAGDFTMLTGDYFSAQDTLDGKPNPDSMMHLRYVYSDSPGKNKGTRDEIMYAIKKKCPHDPRFQYWDQTKTFPPHRPGLLGIWHGIEFSSDVKNAVDSRYQRLAVKNYAHFQDPKGKGGGAAGTGLVGSAGGSYRAMHEEALLMAGHMKTMGLGIDEAMMREAAAQHYLQDSFASGHIRTPRKSLQRHWAAKHGDFFEKLKESIVDAVDGWLSQEPCIAGLVGGMLGKIRAQLKEKVREQTASTPPLGFGDVVSLLTHDVENEKGLHVTNDVGMQWETFGDDKMSNGKTQEMVELACRLGYTDIQNAYRIGYRPDEPFLETIRAHAQLPGNGAMQPGKYAAEHIVPRPDPAKNNGTLSGWEANTAAELWGNPVRSHEKLTYGQALAQSLRGGELQKTLIEMANGFPEEQSTRIIGLDTGTLHPAKAFHEAFIKALTAAPIPGFENILRGLAPGAAKAAPTDVAAPPVPFVGKM
ncbi:MAG: DUF4157 domain-containing protein [Myxococcales bacterium]|nr:DUF4157 domain-containing protein [Myxococcales bacterium]